MSIIADALRMLTNLGNFGSQFIGLDAGLTPPTSGSGGGGEYLAASVTGMTGGLGSSLNSRQMITGIHKPTNFLTQFDRNRGMRPTSGWTDPRWAKHTKYLYNPNDKMQTALKGKPGLGVDNPMKGRSGAAVNILPWTASVVGYLELLTGFGPPNEGDDLKVGAQLWSALRDELASAIPNEDWHGEASDAYAAQVAALRDIAQTLADLDGQLAEIVANQAEWVTHIRLGFGILLNLLTTAIVIEVVLRIALAYVPGGPTWAVGWAIAASSLAMAAALGMLGALTGLSVENGKKADRVASEIDRQREAAAQIAIESTTRSEVSEAPQSRISDFQVLSQSTSTTFAAAGGDESTPRKRAKGKPEYPQTGASPTANSSPSDDAKRADKQHVTMPTLGELIRMSEQKGNDSRSVSSLRRANSLKQADADEPAAAAAAATVEAGEAGAGTDAADRAPIGVEVQTKQPPKRELAK